jgi:hypothetical protein
MMICNENEEVSVYVPGFERKLCVRRRWRSSRVFSRSLVSISLQFVFFFSGSLRTRSLFFSLSPKPFVIARNLSSYEFLLELWRWRFSDDDFQGKSLRTFCEFETLLLNWTHFAFWYSGTLNWFFCILNDEFDEELVWIWRFFAVVIDLVVVVLVCYGGSVMIVWVCYGGELWLRDWWCVIWLLIPSDTCDELAWIYRSTCDFWSNEYTTPVLGLEKLGLAGFFSLRTFLQILGLWGPTCNLRKGLDCQDLDKLT